MCRFLVYKVIPYFNRITVVRRFLVYKVVPYFNRVTVVRRVLVYKVIPYFNGITVVCRVLVYKVVPYFNGITVVCRVLCLQRHPLQPWSDLEWRMWQDMPLWRCCYGTNQLWWQVQECMKSFGFCASGQTPYLLDASIWGHLVSLAVEKHYICLQA